MSLCDNLRLVSISKVLALVGPFNGLCRLRSHGLWLIPSLRDRPPDLNQHPKPRRERGIG
nr:MAG TPA: hypothetical protein [Caudoviricetes sp.]